MEEDKEDIMNKTADKSSVGLVKNDKVSQYLEEDDEAYEIVPGTIEISQFAHESARDEYSEKLDKSHEHVKTSNNTQETLIDKEDNKNDDKEIMVQSLNPKKDYSPLKSILKQPPDELNKTNKRVSKRKKRGLK